MSRPSKKDADTLRLWVQLTSAINRADAIGVRGSPTPLGWLVLGFLSIQPGQTASYAKLRGELGLKRANSLTQVLAPLIDAGHVSSFPANEDARERELRLTDQGRSVIGQILQAAFPDDQ